MINHFYMTGLVLMALAGSANAAPKRAMAKPVKSAAAMTLQGLPDVAERVVHGVVNISAKRRPRQHPLHQFFGMPQPGYERRQPTRPSLGSGVIVRRNGLVLTNYHVIKDSEGIEVTLKDGRVFNCSVAGVDPASDLAVLKMVKPPKDLRPVQMGNSDSLRLGSPVLAIGNPMGFGHTVTMGIVSGQSRALGLADYEDHIQTDAAINPGNSGGALLDFSGKLVGINTAIASQTGGSQGIGFAIPVNMARRIMRDLLKSGRVVRGYLGIGIASVDGTMAKALGLKRAGGVLVESVEDGSPAEKGGLKAGDVILELAGKRVANARALRNRIAAMGKGAVARMLVHRGARTVTRQVKLGERPDFTKVRPGMGGGQGLPGAQTKPKGRLDGLALKPLNKGTRQQYRVPARIHHGVVVTGVAAGSAAARAKFQEGDVIIEVNRKRVRNMNEFNRAYNGSSAQVMILVQRGRRTRFLMLRK